ncbi:hypothetical protein CUJ83_08660 [Methanocella sp. CWC-04]|uniref:Major facilitator superfamily (MFS) profile domain-containing protein n=1 Tax=Methanooceanicella nereidis TaxID=2052831 RepID=A0AAP2RF45_9EURY|nr:MFS transporter [Methanocella sp. CWC-04]MCD1295067.1 hypothetical protein [Methanocella sp. CWC-04]
MLIKNLNAAGKTWRPLSRKYTGLKGWTMSDAGKMFLNIPRSRLMVYLLILSLAGFVTSFGAHIIAVNLPSYAKMAGTGFFGIGVLIAIYDLAEVIAKPVFGFVADKKGMKVTMIAGLLVFSLSSLLYIVLDPALLILVRLLQGIGAAAFSVASMALVAEYFKNDLEGPMGIYNAIKGLGYVISPVVGGAIVLYSDFSYLFVACFFVGIAVMFVGLFIKRDSGNKKFDDDDDDDIMRFIGSFKDSRFLPWYLVTMVNMMLMAILFGFLPVYLNVSGFDPLMAGSVMAAVALAFLTIQPLSGVISKRLGFSRTILAGLAAEALFLMIIPFTSGWLTVIVSILDAAAIGVIWTLGAVAVAKAAYEGEMGLAMGNLGSYKEIGDMAGPLAIGLISQFISLTAGFVLCGMLGLAVLAPLILGSLRSRTISITKIAR